MKYAFLIMIILFAQIAVSGGPQMPAPINDVKSRHAADLLKLPGVVSVGIGRNETGIPSIVVGLDGPNSETQAKIPEQLEGHPVLIKIVGTIKTQ
jgi:hypothetical protein